MSKCGFQPDDYRYAPCTRDAKHEGPCAHEWNVRHILGRQFGRTPALTVCDYLTVRFPHLDLRFITEHSAAEQYIIYAIPTARNKKPGHASHEDWAVLVEAVRAFKAGWES